jgi:hypothetical protein
MRYVLLLLSFVLIFSCKNVNDGYHKPENALDAGRSFIEQSLKGRFNNAKQYMLQDEENNYWLAKWSQEFSKISEQEKTGFSTASINILEIADVIPDSVTIIHYTNSYKNVPQKIKVVKHDNDWLVDFKYTFSGNL